MPFNKNCGCKNHQVFRGEEEYKVLKVDGKKIKVLVVEKLREEGYITARTNNLCEGCVKYAEVNKFTISLSILNMSFSPSLKFTQSLFLPPLSLSFPLSLSLLK